MIKSTMADEPHAEVRRQPEEGYDGHDNRSGISNTAAELASKMTSYARTGELISC